MRRGSHLARPEWREDVRGSRGEVPLQHRQPRPTSEGVGSLTTRIPTVDRRWARLVLALYVLVVATLTFAPAVEPRVLSELISLVARITGHAGPGQSRWVERGANVALFVPLALLMCWAAPAVRRRLVWLACAAGSAGVELVQAVFLPDRTASVVDVVTNSSGAAAGVLVHWLLTRRARRPSSESGRRESQSSR